MKKFVSLWLLAVCVCMSFGSLRVSADDHKDITQYLGKTFSEIRQEFPFLYEAEEEYGDGKSFFTDGEICFYFGSGFSNDRKDTDTVNRIVLTHKDTAATWSLGSMMCSAATYMDEKIYMEKEGYELVLQTGEGRHIWSDGEHVCIVTRHPLSSGCLEIDLSMAGDDYS